MEIEVILVLARGSVSANPVLANAPPGNVGEGTIISLFVEA
jgi:hypothetical protein